MKEVIASPKQSRNAIHSDGGARGAPHFSEGKTFWFKYKVHAVSTRSTCHLTPYPGGVFSEKYLIENVENTISESLLLEKILFCSRSPSEGYCQSIM